MSPHPIQIPQTVDLKTYFINKATWTTSFQLCIDVTKAAVTGTRRHVVTVYDMNVHQHGGWSLLQTWERDGSHTNAPAHDFTVFPLWFIYELTYPLSGLQLLMPSHRTVVVK